MVITVFLVTEQISNKEYSDYVYRKKKFLLMYQVQKKHKHSDFVYANTFEKNMKVNIGHLTV